MIFPPKVGQLNFFFLHISFSCISYPNLYSYSFSKNSETDDDSRYIHFRESFMEFMDEIRD